MNNKKYLKYLISAIILFISYHLLIWTFFTSKIFNLDNTTSVGDLARMSYQTNMLHKRQLTYTLPKSFISNTNYEQNQSIDIITIGDSFSHGGAKGKNPYYQDYIASLYNMKVLNINTHGAHGYFSTIISLYKNHFLKQSGVKYIIIESVERFFPQRFSGKLDIHKYKAQEVKITNKSFHVPHLDVLPISTANYKLPYYYFAYLLNNHAKKEVYKLSLTTNFFSKTKNQMLVFHDDINNLPQFTEKNILDINNNFNKIAHLLAPLNIKLIVLPAPDKYDLYYNYIQNNKYPKNPFFNLIRPLKKEYILVDTKEILEKSLEHNITDIYYPDDTHWSYKASEIIVKNKTFKNIFGIQ